MIFNQCPLWVESGHFLLLLGFKTRRELVAFSREWPQYHNIQILITYCQSLRSFHSECAGIFLRGERRHLSARLFQCLVFLLEAISFSPESQRIPESLHLDTRIPPLRLFLVIFPFNKHSNHSMITYIRLLLTSQVRGSLSRAGVSSA